MALLQQTMTLPPPKESNFNMSHKHRTDVFIGMCTPVDTIQMVPGDIIDISARTKMITEALSAPCFGQMRLQMDHFFVPYRILWDKWPDFIRQGEDSELVIPKYGVPLKVTTFGTTGDFVKNLAQGISPIQGDDGYYDYPLAGDLNLATAANVLDEPWINGYREQDFGFVSHQDVPTATAIANAEAPIITSRAVSNNSPFNIVKACSLVNYLDLPVGYWHGGSIDQANIDISMFNVLAYNKIWYEWYRNPQELDYAFYGDKVNVFHGDADLSIQTSSVYSEVFTNEEMESAIDFVNTSLFTNLSFTTGNNLSDTAKKYRKFLFSLKKRCYKHDYLSSVLNASNYDNSTATVTINNNHFTINQWRQALHVDRYKKKNYIGGDKYIDWIRAQYGVIDSDARLQRPELLASISSDIVFVDVESQASTEGATLGQLASRGITLNEQPDNVKLRATEHGVYMVIVSIVPIVDDVYGVPKMVKKTDTFDFFVPALDNIDFQNVYVSEYSATDDVSQALSDDRWLSIYKSSYFVSPEAAARWKNGLDGYFVGKVLGQTRDSTVGYLPAWTEYKTMLNRVTGYLSSTRKDYVLSRPNPFENSIVALDYEHIEISYPGPDIFKAPDGTPDYGKHTILVPEFTDNYLNNIQISQYVDFRDFAYLWPDKNGKYPVCTLQMAFDCVMRRPMSKWSMPL